MIKPKNTEALILTKPDCPDCLATKELFKELNITYEEKTITDEWRIALKEAGYKRAPVVFTMVDSWSGFNESAIYGIKEDVWS